MTHVNKKGKCTCKPFFTGDKCQKCLDNYAGKNCDRCTDTFYGYPDCKGKDFFDNVMKSF